LKYVLSERRVSVDTLKEEKHISDRLVKSEGAGILRKSSICLYGLANGDIHVHITLGAFVHIPHVIRFRY